MTTFDKEFINDVEKLYDEKSDLLKSISEYIDSNDSFHLACKERKSFVYILSQIAIENPAFALLAFDEKSRMSLLDLCMLCFILGYYRRDQSTILEKMMEKEVT